MIEKKYKARKGGILNNNEAQKIGERLETLKEKEGVLTPEIVVEDSKSSDSPYHKFFKWGDDSKCAYEYRKGMARQIINNVVAEVIVNDKPVEQRSFFNVKNKKGDKVYVSYEEVVENEDYLEQLIEEAQQYINYLNNTLSMLLSELKKRKGDKK